MINKIKKGHGKIAFLQHEKAIFGSCLSPDFDLNYPDFHFHRKSGLFRTGPSPDSIPSKDLTLEVHGFNSSPNKVLKFRLVFAT